MVVLKKRNVHKTFLIHWSLFVVLLSGMWIGGSPDVGAAPFDYSGYQQFLAKYVVPAKYIGEIKLSVVDYDAIQRDRGKSDSLY
jgi:hypothetical protein